MQRDHFFVMKSKNLPKICICTIPAASGGCSCILWNPIMSSCLALHSVLRPCFQAESLTASSKFWCQVWAFFPPKQNLALTSPTGRVLVGLIQPQHWVWFQVLIPSFDLTWLLLCCLNSMINKNMMDTDVINMNTYPPAKCWQIHLVVYAKSILFTICQQRQGLASCLLCCSDRVPGIMELLFNLSSHSAWFIWLYIYDNGIIVLILTYKISGCLCLSLSCSPMIWNKTCGIRNLRRRWMDGGQVWALSAWELVVFEVTQGHFRSQKSLSNRDATKLWHKRVENDCCLWQPLYCNRWARI